MEEYTGTFEMVPFSHIVVDHTYQRPRRTTLIAAIADDPRWELFGVPVMFKRNTGMYYCVDGQQRIEGFKTSKDGPTKVPVIWFPMVELADEAATFVQINEFRIALTMLQKHKGKITALDPTTLAIERVVEKVGLSTGASTGRDSRSITSLGALYKIYNDLGEDGLLQTLVAARDGFTDDSQALSHLILRGIAMVIEEQGENYNRQKMVRSLTRTTAHAVLRKADELKIDIGGSKEKNVRRALKLLAKV